MPEFILKMQMNQTLVFLSGKRTPLGAFGGKLKEVSPTDLAHVAAKAALSQATVFPQQLDHILFGNVLSSTPESIYIPRHIGLKLGALETTPALGVNRLCGTGFQVIIEAFQQMNVGDSEVLLIGGTENMSMAPYVLRSARWGTKMGHSQIADLMTESLYDSYIQMPMAITAENIAEKYKISRRDSDDFALRSQELYEEAHRGEKFSEEITPYHLVSRSGSVTTVSEDEHPRPKTTAEGLSLLKPLFKKNGVVTAGNSSGIVDGAAAMVVCSEARAQQEGWNPLGRLVSYGIMGCDPKFMGMGPVPAIQKALYEGRMKLKQMDLIEVNEAFAPQVVAVERELEISPTLLNVNGGAIALGHPLAASGVRIILSLLYELRRRKKRYGLGSACIGGGQGIAMIVEAFRA